MTALTAVLVLAVAAALIAAVYWWAHRPAAPDPEPKSWYEQNKPILMHMTDEQRTAWLNLEVQRRMMDRKRDQS